VLLSPLAGLLGACSPANSLQGSMEDLTSLTFTTVEVKLQQTPQQALVVEYTDFVDAGSGNIPFELTVDITGVHLDAGFSILLDGGTAAGNPIGVASRSVLDDQRTFSPIDRGYITLDTPVTLGAAASGSFFTVFLYETDGSLGTGHTVYGNFQAKVTQ
jgi:hypothetical protein